ncbi:DUF2975 domain-containing protein [uncultured Arthrobacter sp.]|uniref:DUF2975 domain-containing protein n=1 Tax=uncultured Arthrobacter sp. TaxID=114050 RepID=UPI00260CB711|nr:DUF2975 domain-containing protein [uncultured Arthrobacter sp.]
MTRQHVALFRLLIGVLAVGSLAAQLVVVPQVASNAADRYPEVAHLEIPYATAVVVAIGFFEVALLAAWRLLATARKEERRLSDVSQRWIDLMAVSLCLMALLFAGICVHAGSVENIGGPAMLFGLLVSLALIGGVVAGKRRLKHSTAASRRKPPYVQ